MEKVYTTSHQGDNIEISRINNDQVGINLTLDQKKTGWVIFEIEQAKEIVKVLNEEITIAELGY